MSIAVGDKAPEFKLRDQNGKSTSLADFRGKKAVVIGSNNSAHDICADLWENDARVTMVQRSSTLVARADTLREMTSGRTGCPTSSAGMRGGITRAARAAFGHGFRH